MDPTDCADVTCIPLSSGAPPDLGWYAEWWLARQGVPAGTGITSVVDLTGNGHALFAADSVIPGLPVTLYDNVVIPSGSANVGGEAGIFPPLLLTDLTAVLWPPLPQPFTVWAVMHWDPDLGTKYQLIADLSLNAGSPFQLSVEAGGLWELAEGNGGNTQTGGAAPLVHGNHLIEVVCDDNGGTGWTLTVDGVVEIPAYSPGAAGDQTNMVFARSASPIRPEGYIAFAGVVDRVATAADSSAMLAWATTVYGV